MDNMSEGSSSSYHGKRPRSLSEDSFMSSENEVLNEHISSPLQSPVSTLKQCPSIDDQKKLLGDTIEEESELEVGDVEYVLSYSWYQSLCEHLSEGGPDPGPIDQNDITDEDTGDLERNLQEESDFVLVPEHVWKILISWYGLNGKSYPRNVINQGTEDSSHLIVEVYPPRFRLALLVLPSEDSKKFSAREDIPLVTFSSKSSIKNLLKAIKETFNLDTDEFRLWRLESETLSKPTIDPSSFIKLGSRELLNFTDVNISLIDAEIDSDTDLVIECTVHGNWPVDHALRVQYMVQRASKNGGQADAEAKSKKMGLCGLANLGNTCYMNSALQCLSHTPELVDFFQNQDWKEQVNETNPLGTGGQIASVYADLIKALYSSEAKDFFSPRHFKAVVGRLNHSFIGYQQQDSQEFLAFLLDGLHEDLNRIQQKPYTEKPDLFENDPQKIIDTANECWKLHKMRNDSVIVDTFQGMYKSTLVCPECNKVSITFDPFMDLTLPLPVSQNWTHTVLYVPKDITRKPVSVEVVFENKSATIDTLRNFVAEKVGCEDAAALLVAETYRGRFYRYFTNVKSSVMMDISEDDEIYIYELDRPFDLSNNKNCIVPVYHEEELEMTSSYEGLPFLLVLDEEEACDKNAIINKITTKYAQFTTYDIQQEENRQKLFEKVNAATEANIESLFKVNIFHDRSEKLPTGWYMQASNKVSLDERLSKQIESADESQVASPVSETKSDEEAMEEDDTEDVPEGPLMLPLAPMEKLAGKLVQGDVLECSWNEHVYAEVFGDFVAPTGLGRALWTEFERIEERRKPEEKKDISLDDCLNEFEKTEQLSEEDPWYCPNCKEFRCAYKQMELWFAPDVLIFHLKRFSSERRFRDKIDVLINFPIKSLDLTNRIGSNKQQNKPNETIVYDLFAVDNHYGSLGGGHYTAYAINSTDQRFYCFDDSRVSPATDEEVVSPAAYLLFYRRRRSPSSDAK
ncbi:ubiquitin carboxy terminal hydrolase Ubp12 [Schizosaccharomyces japonicus yFS275]|uniref:Ubiquitin carboxyl-terminal hydrolase n=1 Tax=Schizosaccharomyces japonicus (strain yFS275 / FY16936) TaxID=402676 RepID=B6K7E2_SCHJY|nr:ubiquitin carboxy terminal hydrolase Ubp12 [Schizosaccharomyces japonicus yFS275]EEB09446.1 ubiquitin carboxy terminal hydrolase Ubp12 [Schizosaccharomyces japonicus yFS275]